MINLITRILLFLLALVLLNTFMGPLIENFNIVFSALSRVFINFFIIGLFSVVYWLVARKKIHYENRDELINRKELFVNITNQNEVDNNRVIRKVMMGLFALILLGNFVLAYVYKNDRDIETFLWFGTLLLLIFFILMISQEFYYQVSIKKIKLSFIVPLVLIGDFIAPFVCFALYFFLLFLIDYKSQGCSGPGCGAVIIIPISYLFIGVLLSFITIVYTYIKIKKHN